MLKLKKDGKVIITEMDDGTLIIEEEVEEVEDASAGEEENSKE